MQSFLKKATDALLDALGIASAHHDVWERWVALLLVAAVAVVLDVLCRFTVVEGVRRLVRRTRVRWDDELFSPAVLRWACRVVLAVLLTFILPVIFGEHTRARTVVLRLAQAGLIYVVFRLINALLYAAFRIVAQHPAWQNKPIKGLRQTGQGIAALICGVLAVSALLDKSPTVFLTGLGASAAIVLLIFRDSILGFVSGIQLSANDMVRVGDWIAVPKYGADGTVEEVSLNTVKIRNWDNTIVTLPPYVLVSESFQNWRAMQQSGGRRVMRSVSIDMRSVRFCTPEMLGRYRRIALLRDYIDRTERQAEEYNAARGVDPASDPADGRRQTNLGVFRAYLAEYLRRTVPVNPSMTLMVRQLQPTETGIPLQLYFFTKTVVWPEYEAVQADVFDHVLAVVSEFDLRIFQAPSGSDVAALGAGGRCGPGPAPSEAEHQDQLDDHHAQEHADGVDRGV